MTTIENTDAEQVERLNGRIMELLRERDAMAKPPVDNPLKAYTVEQLQYEIAWRLRKRK
jgi:hypothetical protein